MLVVGLIFKKINMEFSMILPLYVIGVVIVSSLGL